MSQTVNNPNTYLFSFPPQQQQSQQQEQQQVKLAAASAQPQYPGGYSCSPPSSTGVDVFDFDSPVSFEFENTFGLSPSSSSAPSTNVVSPKSATLDFNLVSDNDLDNQSPTNLNTAEALSSHHLQRYLHYKALAEQAEAQHKLLSEQLESLFTFGMPVDPTTNATVNFGNVDLMKDANMMAYQPQPQVQPQQVTVPPPQQQQQAIYGSVNPWHQQQQQLPAQVPAPSSDLFHAQARTHLQAHQAAQAAQVSMNTVIPNMSTGPTYFVPQQQVDSNWSRQSTSSIASVSAPTTPAAPLAVPMMTSMTAPTVVMSSISSSSHEGESELDRASVMSDEEMKPHLPVDIPLTNLNGGGRGYVPGQTPDDPKKRHKCTVCGRGFARAFNLKASSFSLSSTLT